MLIKLCTDNISPLRRQELDFNEPYYLQVGKFGNSLPFSFYLIFMILAQILKMFKKSKLLYHGHVACSFLPKYSNGTRVNSEQHATLSFCLRQEHISLLKTIIRLLNNLIISKQQSFSFGICAFSFCNL